MTGKKKKLKQDLSVQLQFMVQNLKLCIQLVKWRVKFLIKKKEKKVLVMIQFLLLIVKKLLLVK